MNKNVFIYRIDFTDTIIRVSENWADFANENAWSGSVRPEEVVGHSLWDFIQGRETRHLYQALIRRVRMKTPSKVISFRCDSPGERRHLELLIEALPDDQIEITSRILRTEARTPIRLLGPDAPRSKEIVSLCSVCKKVKISSEKWVELEDGLAHLKIFEKDEMPKLSHGLCQSCFKDAMRELNEISAPQPCSCEKGHD
jgi:hypothetical protein